MRCVLANLVFAAVLFVSCSSPSNPSSSSGSGSSSGSAASGGTYTDFGVQNIYKDMNLEEIYTTLPVYRGELIRTTKKSYGSKSYDENEKKKSSGASGEGIEPVRISCYFCIDPAAGSAGRVFPVERHKTGAFYLDPYSTNAEEFSYEPAPAKSGT